MFNTPSDLALPAALHRLAQSLHAAAQAREVLCRESLVEYAHEEEGLLAAAEADLAAERRVLRAYRAVIAPALEHEADPKLGEHFRAERRWVTRLSPEMLRELAGAYRALALVLGGRR